MGTTVVFEAAACSLNLPAIVFSDLVRTALLACEYSDILIKANSVMRIVGQLSLRKTAKKENGKMFISPEGLVCFSGLLYSTHTYTNSCLRNSRKGTTVRA